MKGTEEANESEKEAGRRDSERSVLDFGSSLLDFLCEKGKNPKRTGNP